MDLEGFAKPGSQEAELLKKVDRKRLPKHVAVIMDGNGRWAGMRKLPRVAGHHAGIDSVREIVDNSVRLGLEVLTLYAFSVENWKRPKDEINLLMELLRQYLRNNLDTLMENDIRLTAIGRIRELPRSVQLLLRRTEKQTAGNRRLQLNLALNYGSRSEMVHAVRRIISEQIPADQVDESTFGKFLYTAGCPDPDLLIRTSGELRISNFLLYQIAYSELYFTPILWPDFKAREFFRAIIAFQGRERRFGNI